MSQSSDLDDYLDQLEIKIQEYSKNIVTQDECDKQFQVAMGLMTKDTKPSKKKRFMQLQSKYSNLQKQQQMDKLLNQITQLAQQLERNLQKFRTMASHKEQLEIYTESANVCESLYKMMQQLDSKTTDQNQNLRMQKLLKDSQNLINQFNKLEINEAVSNNNSISIKVESHSQIVIYDDKRQCSYNTIYQQVEVDPSKLVQNQNRVTRSFSQQQEQVIIQKTKEELSPWGSFCLFMQIKCGICGIYSNDDTFSNTDIVKTIEKTQTL